MTHSGLSQILSEPERKMSVEQCLKLARAIKWPPAEVLRRANQLEAAAVIDDLWPRKRDYVVLTENEREVIEQWRTMTIEDRFHIGSVIRRLAEKPDSARTAGPPWPEPVVRRASLPVIKPGTRRSRSPAG